MSQTGLTDFEDDGDSRSDRVVAEAKAIAGRSDQPAMDVVDAEDVRFPDPQGQVELMVTQVDYSIEGQGGEEYPVIHVFGRTAGNEAKHVRVLGFRPYFYAPTDSLEDKTLDNEAITGTEEGFQSIRGEALTRIYGQTPRDVGELRDEFDHYEADILFPNRFLIDKDINEGICVPARYLDGDAGGVGDAANGDEGDSTADGNTHGTTIQVPHNEVESTPVEADLRVNFFDIEVDDRSGFPEEGEEPIVCLSSHDSYRDEYIAWLYEAPVGDAEAPEALDGYGSIHDDTDIQVHSFDSEEAMLAAFLDYIDETDPDIASGWNFEDFDAPYLLDRLERLDPRSEHDLRPDRLSRIDEVWRSGWGGPNVKGRVVFDLLYAYKRTMFTELESYRLDAVAELELDVGKERYTGDLGDLWEQEPERLLEYNLRDVELCVEIDRKQEIIPFWNEVRTFVGCKLEDAPTPGDAVDVYVLHKVHGEFALPSKGKTEGEEYEGGAVFEPITGLKENVTVLDLKSLYPMCMVTTNASPETKVDPEDYGGDTYRAPNGIHFRKEPDGIIRSMVDELLAEREQKKSQRNDHDPGSQAYEQFDRQQAAVKVIMNCFTPDTEVLTPDGIRNIRELDVGDEVYSLDPDSMEMEVKPVTETHAYPDYDRELVDIQTSNIDFRVTPNHRMLVRKNETNGITEDDYQFVEAGELDRATNYELPHDWSAEHGEALDEVDLTRLLDTHTDEYEVWVRPSVHGHTFTAEIGGQPRRVRKNDIGEVGYVFSATEFEQHREYLESVCERSYVHAESGRKWIPRTYDGDDFLELLAWYVTEGSVYTSERKQFGDKIRGAATSVQLAQEAVLADGGKSDHAAIGELLDRMGFDYYADDDGYQFTSKLLGDLLTDRCGADSFEKRIPDLLWDCSERQKRLFLETLVDGDGDRQLNSWRYTTASEQLRDDVLKLCTHLGLTANYGKDSGSWRIYVAENAKNTLRMYRSSSRSTADNGVYCVTVADNHTLMAGRNGKFQFVGQSLYGVLGWDRFRLYDQDMGAAVTATGRDVIEHTEQAANEVGHEVAYGDTDSVMLELGSEYSKEEAIESSFEIEEHINDSYDEFARERLNAESHRFQIEFEKLYRRFFQAGKKKRYAGHIIWKEGKDVDDIDITGFEYKRSDIAPITKQVQKKVLEMIVTGQDREEINDYLNEVITDFLKGNLPLDEIGIPGGIGKRLSNYDTDTAQVRGAKYANLLLGTNFQRGSKPKRLYLKKIHPAFFRRIEKEEGLDPQANPLYAEFKRNPDVICFAYADQIPEEFEIDWDKMLEKTLKGPIERVIEALDISWEEVKTGQEQTGLGSFT